VRRRSGVGLRGGGDQRVDRLGVLPRGGGDLRERELRRRAASICERLFGAFGIAAPKRRRRVQEHQDGFVHGFHLRERV